MWNFGCGFSQIVVAFGVYNNFLKKLKNINKDFQLLSEWDMDWINEEVGTPEEKLFYNSDESYLYINGIYICKFKGLENVTRYLSQDVYLKISKN